MVSGKNLEVGSWKSELFLFFARVRWIALVVILSLFVINAAADTNSSFQEFTSTRCVTSMAIDQYGTLWVGTRGGILKRDITGKWTKQTTQDGLPSNEVESVAITKTGTVKVLFPNATEIWKDQQWFAEKSTSKQPKQYQLPQTQWQHKTVQATWSGLQIGDQHIKMPTTTGSYISALLPQGKVLLVAIYGDGIWSYDGRDWKRSSLSLPPEAKQITALGYDATSKVLFVGTRRAGVWMFDGEKWQQHLQANEPYNDDIQSLISFQGNLFATTLEDGLLQYANGRWFHFDESTLSSNAPRQMVVFQDNLYVQYGNGKVDRFDGKVWQRNVFPNLPRGKVYSLAADDKNLYLGQWGGWSKWDGKSFQHFLKIPELQGVPVMLLHPIGYSLWIGTQSLGIARYYDYQKNQFHSGSFQIFDARQGLPDDWITAIACNSEENLFVGTFVGGLARKSISGWETFTPVAGENVTALEMDGTGGAYIATRHGVWHKSESDIWRNYQQSYPALAPEAQALLNTPQGLWIGTRTGLFLLNTNK